MRTFKDRVIEGFAAGAGVPYNACYCLAFCAGLVVSHYFVRHHHFGLFVYLMIMTPSVLAVVAPVFGLSVWAKILLRRKTTASNQAAPVRDRRAIHLSSERRRHRPSPE
ncbi:hypothetical protein [Labrys miyagiensis]|uniref:hypothetical protein n=1 Tax=Labrys miyagiensis TaxID=346912 RepID=UPI0024E04FC7|nr:hypothetical protein [Labrys miyagiensis]